MEPQWDGAAGYLCSVQQRWAGATLPPGVLTRSNLSPHSPLPPPCFNPFISSAQRYSHPPASSLSLFTLFLSHPLFLLRQVGSEMAISGKAVSLYFEEKLQEMFPGQSFPETPESEAPDTKEKEEDDTDDSEGDFIQPRRKRLKTDEKVLHIKWEPTIKETRSEKLSSSRPTLLLCLRQQTKGWDSLYKLLGLSHPCLWKNYCQLHYQNSWGQKHRRATFPPYFMDTEELACTVGLVLQ